MCLNSQLLPTKMMKNRTLNKDTQLENMIPKPGCFSTEFIKHVIEEDMFRMQCTLKNAASYVTHCYQQWVWNDPVKNQSPEKFANELIKIADFIQEDESASRKIGLLMKEVTFMLIFIAENVHTWSQHKETWSSRNDTQIQLNDYIESMKKACHEVKQIDID